MDILNTLPDSLLGYILSFLESPLSAATVSKRFCAAINHHVALVDTIQVSEDGLEKFFGNRLHPSVSRAKSLLLEDWRGYDANNHNKFLEVCDYFLSIDSIVMRPKYCECWALMVEGLTDRVAPFEDRGKPFRIRDLEVNLSAIVLESIHPESIRRVKHAMERFLSCCGASIGGIRFTGRRSRTFMPRSTRSINPDDFDIPLLLQLVEICPRVSSLQILGFPSAAINMGFDYATSVCVHMRHLKSLTLVLQGADFGTRSLMNIASYCPSLETLRISDVSMSSAEEPESAGCGVPAVFENLKEVSIEFSGDVDTIVHIRGGLDALTSSDVPTARCLLHVLGKVPQLETLKLENNPSSVEVMTAVLFPLFSNLKVLHLWASEEVVRNEDLDPIVIEPVGATRLEELFLGRGYSVDFTALGELTSLRRLAIEPTRSLLTSMKNGLGTLESLEALEIGSLDGSLLFGADSMGAIGQNVNRSERAKVLSAISSITSCIEAAFSNVHTKGRRLHRLRNIVLPGILMVPSLWEAIRNSCSRSPSITMQLDSEKVFAGASNSSDVKRSLYLGGPWSCDMLDELLTVLSEPITTIGMQSVRAMVGDEYEAVSICDYMDIKMQQNVLSLPDLEYLMSSFPSLEVFSVDTVSTQQEWGLQPSPGFELFHSRSEDAGFLSSNLEWRLTRLEREGIVL